MEIRKIFKTGNSLVLSLPAKVLKEMGFAEGTHLSLAVEEHDGKCIVLRPLKMTGGADPAASLEDFLKHYGDALEKLEENDTTHG